MGETKIKRKYVHAIWRLYRWRYCLLTLLYVELLAFVKKGTSYRVFTQPPFQKSRFRKRYPSDFELGSHGKCYEPRQTARYEAVLEKDGEVYGVAALLSRKKRFVTASTFGVPIGSMQRILDFLLRQQDKLLKEWRAIPVTLWMMVSNHWVHILVRWIGFTHSLSKLMRQLPTLWLKM